MNNLVNGRDQFFDFDHGHVTEGEAKIIGFSKTARRISMKIKLYGPSSILFQLKISKTRKSNLKKSIFENFAYLHM